MTHFQEQGKSSQRLYVSVSVFDIVSVAAFVLFWKLSALLYFSLEGTNWQRHKEPCVLLSIAADPQPCGMQ